jgi:hypothetical protein
MVGACSANAVRTLYGLPFMNTDAWYTYAEAAEKLGVSRQALRLRAIRGRWPRTKGNDGQARVQIPEQPYPVRTPHVPVHVPSYDVSAMEALQGHVETLKGELAGANERAAAADARAVAAEARATAAEARVGAADDRADRLLTELASAHERTITAEARVAAAEARAEAELAAERERSSGHRADYERERDRADAVVVDMAGRIAEAENLRGELAGANERAAAADVRSVTAEARAAAGEARADQLVADLNSLAARMAEVIVQQMTPPEPEPEPVPWWQRWRRRA